ncbi:MAG: sodium:solute symporter [Candidatus Aminicenantes bacterium RBG_19FT_COMBO_59_29]|nr:MAG: sodium:solute symporter [Candidatus Aminicenantes bacterium RBG_19FT_COMBO_59_29]
MRPLDWILLISFLGFVAVYGIWKTRGKKDIQGYFLADKSTPWYIITVSIMATQASAITFLSTPGQAYVDGMRFVQFYFGLPVAMVILSITAVPIFHRLKVYTAYEFLEQRFDLKNRALGSILFLIQRGLAAGFTILAPALIISVILGWDFRLTIFLVGGLVILYTAAGGTEAVYKTHLLQLSIVTVGMAAALFMVFHRLPPDISFSNALQVAGKLGRLNVVNFAFDWKDRYNFWSGLIGGGFVALAYFGTDQSQVQRYLTGRSIAQSRLGLLANGVVKVPMQFIILFIGAMIFVFYQFVTPPLFFNPVETAQVKSSAYGEAYTRLETDQARLSGEKQGQIRDMLAAIEARKDEDVAGVLEKLRRTRESEAGIRQEALELIKKQDPLAETNDTNYIFLSFVTRFLPVGLVGLILAAILSASMASSAAELSALASVTVIDIYKRLGRRNAPERHYLRVSKLATVFWGLYAIAFAQFANHLGSLIEAVNIMGSLFYGTILGIFLIAFYIKKIRGHATFIAAIIAEATVLACFFFTKIPYLWFNVIGCVVLVVLAGVMNPLLAEKKPARI